MKKKILSTLLILSLQSFLLFSQTTAQKIVPNMVFGWNLGNTLDAPSETGWGQPKTTEAMIQGLVDAGINSIRIPVSWCHHVDSKNNIKPSFMARVKEIVDWCIERDMYVIINSHHDNELKHANKGYYPSSEYKEKSEAFLSSIWKQISEEFKDYGENLIFETLNEPRLVKTSCEWAYTPSCSACKDAMNCVNDFNQLIVDTIRASGGNNKTRAIAIPSIACSPDAALSKDFKVPVDDNIIVAVHMYTPYNFAMQSPGTRVFSNSARSNLKSYFIRLNDKFISKGIPVYIGEMGATNKNNLEDREAWFSFFVSEAKKFNMCSFLWDNGSWEVYGTDYNEKYGFYCRTEASWYFPTLIEKAVTSAGGSYKSIPPYTEEKSKFSFNEKKAVEILNNEVSLDDKNWQKACVIDGDLFSKAIPGSKIAIEVEKISNAEYVALRFTGKNWYPVLTLDGKKEGFTVSTDANGDINVKPERNVMFYELTAKDLANITNGALEIHGYGMKIKSVKFQK